MNNAASISLEVFERDLVVPAIVITDEWLSGFCDGECSIGISGHGGSLQPRFRLNQRDDDGDLVRAIHEHLKVGSFCTKLDAANPNANPQLALTVVGRDCLVLVDLFEAHPLRSKKRFEYPFWRSAVAVYVNHQGSRWGAPNAVRARQSALEELKDELEHVRAYGGAR